MKLAFPDDSASRLIAAATAMAIVLLMGKFLLRAPYVASSADEPKLRVRYIQRESSPQIPPPPMLPPTSLATTRSEKARAVAPGEDARNPRPQATVPVTAPQADRLYTRTGQVRLPSEVAVDPMASTAAVNPPGLPNERELERARKLLYPPNPVEVKETRFNKDWATDGTLGDVAAQKMGDGMKAIAKQIFGEEPEPAAARPPPEVRFNPRLHEQTADLGREETGDAYKAAPIAFEKAPDLVGGASRRIRQQRDAVLKRHAACDSRQIQRLMAPVQTHLGELEGVESAMTHGADPVMTEHMLPRRGDSAYDLARRALWYADNRLAGCK